MVDGLHDLVVDLDVRAAHGEALGAWAFDADAQDCGYAGTGMGAVDRDVEG